MKKYSQQFKQTLVEKALSNPAMSMRECARQNNVSNSSLYQWIKQYGSGGLTPEGQSNAPDVTIQEKLKVLLDTSNLGEAEIGAYCRKHGIFSHQLTQWREELMSNTTTDNKNKYRSEIKALKTKTKQLEKELRRKDKALAEASALLILKKKAEMLWGENGED